MRSLLLMLTITVAACGANPTKATLSGPSPVNASIVYDTSVVWSPTEVGKVTVTNSRTLPLTLTFVLWNYRGPEDQTSIGVATYILNPNETRVLTVGAKLACVAKVQRDLYEGSFALGVTLSDVRNFLYAADARLWPAESCTPPPTPPVPPVTPPLVGVCEDMKALNYDKSLPCVYPPPPCHHGGSYGTSTVKPCKPNK